MHTYTGTTPLSHCHPWILERRCIFVIWRSQTIQDHTISRVAMAPVEGPHYRSCSETFVIFDAMKGACESSGAGYQANTQRNKHVIVTSKRRFHVIISCLLHFVFAWYTPHLMLTNIWCGSRIILLVIAMSRRWPTCRKSHHVSSDILWAHGMLTLGSLMFRASTNTWQAMMTSSSGNILRVTGHLCGEFTDPWWIPHTKASDAEVWCFLWSASE